MFSSPQAKIEYNTRWSNSHKSYKRYYNRAVIGEGIGVGVLTATGADTQMDGCAVDMMTLVAP